jgi:perosamine synthetase
MGVRADRYDGFIPVSSPLLTEAEFASVTRAVREFNISSAGPDVRRFEQEWAAYCQRRHGVAVANGTVALQLATACLDMQPGDEIIMPTFTIISCALAAIYAGAVPRFVDVDPETWTMDIAAVRQAIGDRTRAIMPVHVYGHPVEMDPILQLAERHELRIIEDAAEAHGAEYRSTRNGAARWRRCGSFGDVSCFSFYANKLITTGEGGMLLTDDVAIADRARLLRNLAFTPERRFEHSELGFNFRMTNLQAALGVPQVGRMGEIVARKREIAERYTAGLTGLGQIQLQREQDWARSVHWMYAIVVNESTGLDAAALAERLAAHGVETRPFFLGMHEQPVLIAMGIAGEQKFPVAERLSRQGLYLPSGPALDSRDIERVVAAVHSELS